MSSARIVPFEPRLAPWFGLLNREWIERYFVVEPPDLAVLEDPEGAIIATGGMIWFALLADDVVGTCAVLPHEPGVLELAKMAVAPAAQGRGVGRLLGEQAIVFARDTGARSLMLLTNSRLAPAIHLYKALGFVHAPMPPGVEYQRANVHMVFPLAKA